MQASGYCGKKIKDLADEDLAHLALGVGGALDDLNRRRGIPVIFQELIDVSPFNHVGGQAGIGCIVGVVLQEIQDGICGVGGVIVERFLGI